MNFAKLLKSKVVEGAFKRETAERMARDVLSNPVIEDFRVEVEG
jgi:phosphoribosylformylglycinamidine (FGAM) synthase PurS component